MNKLSFRNGQIYEQELDDSILIECFDSEIKEIENLKIMVLKSTDLELSYVSNSKTKYNVLLEVADNINFNLLEKKSGEAIKNQYTINIGANVITNIYKFYDLKDVKEVVNINLNGINSKLNYYFKTISKHKEKYNMYIKHNAINTTSNINNSGVNIMNGELSFDISSSVESKIINCNINQASRIINLTDNVCSINPNLYIEENDVTANHSATIGKFSDDELFYLMSRGISHDQAISLLIKGFLLSDFDNNPDNVIYIENIINSYWGE